MPPAIERIVDPRLVASGQLHHEEIVLAFGIAEPVSLPLGIFKQLVVEPLLGNLLELRAGRHHHALAVLRTTSHEVHDRARRSHRERGLEPERVLRGVGRAHPVLVFARAALPNLDRLGAEHVQGGADRIDAVDVVARRFGVEILLHPVIVLEHVRERVHVIGEHENPIVGKR